ncbi:hypothetical protein ACF3NR_00910 [Vaginella massiliensis]|uniref:hypothetical protein n=1 Tax=Vaginella massiliensis TaxID=1816680 RepID=UPI000A4ECD84|nr:hypothetical protein [Vaginella massiliensis]
MSKVFVMLTIVSKHFLRKNVVAMTVFPFILVRDKQTKFNKKTMNHETIHIVQQLELFWFVFFIWYFVEYGLRILQYKDPNLAYRNISFEREAYANDQNLDYLKTRKLFSFLNYL